LTGRETLLKGSVLRLTRSVDEKPAEQPCSGSGGSPEPGIPADCTGDSTDAGARSGAGQRALLGWGHIGASSKRHSEGREQQ
jgi:hypothetical protein